MTMFARSFAFGARSFWQYRPLRSRVTVEGGRRTIYGIRLITPSLSQSPRYGDSGGHARIISNMSVSCMEGLHAVSRL